ncbi:MAG: Gfo/Idh/MocA family oxidoreductase [Ruminococcaceae bacterium]|nr:Gfo/Idh/MocA family oxidoreductase [Oscillospiraceae bacterium]
MVGNKKGVAIVGFGGMGSWHKNKLLNSDVAELCGIWDIKEDRRQAARDENIHVYTSFEDVLADEKVDIVTIAVPNELHMPLSIAALEAGKNVISEKPVCLSSEELANIIAASERTGKLFTTHQNRRWDADFLMMKQVYESGDLGDVFAIESRVQGSHGIPGDWRGKKEHGGGMMLDWGVHLIDQILQITKERKIERIYCVFDHITNYEVDDGFKLDIYFEEGLVARVEVGTSHFISLPRHYMNGSNGTAIIRGWGKDCEVVCCKNWEDKDVVPVVTAAGLTKTMAPRNKDTITEYVIPSPKPDVHDFYRNYCLAVDGKAEQIVTHKELMRVMKVMEAAFESDAAGKPVDFADTI